MKIKRHKHTKRVLKFYETNFDVDPKNVNILIDGTFANEALKSKINIAEQMPKFFDIDKHKCKLLTTKCALHETEILGKPTYGAMLILKQYELVECIHKRNFVSTEKCFKNILRDSKENKDKLKYFVATQIFDYRLSYETVRYACEKVRFCAKSSESLKKIVREIEGIPLIVLSHSAINLESPSQISVKHVEDKTNAKLKPKEDQLEIIKKLKDKLLHDKNEVKRLHKKRKAKGPNPLSCLKSKKKKNIQQMKTKSF